MSEPTPDSSQEPIKEPIQEPKAQGVFSKSATGLRPRTAKRILIFVVLLGALVFGFTWFMDKKDSIRLSSDTSRDIAALKLDGSGSQAVVIDADGKVTASQGYVADKSDRDLAWDPTGDRLFFISDRKEDSFHIFQWDPQRNGDPDQKSIDRAGRSSLSFDVQDDGKRDLMGLVIVRGTVQEFTAKNAKSQQVMPPPKRSSAEDPDGGGSSGNFELLYKRYGQSFRSAKWFKNQRYIAAVMRREERGESLIIQDSQPDEKGNVRPPFLVMVGERIMTGVDKATGNLIFSVMDVYALPDETGKVQKYPFKHGMFIFDPDKGRDAMGPIAISQVNDACFATPVPSPDGHSLMFLIGKYKGDGIVETQSLGTCPLEIQGGQKGGPLVVGNVTDPAFSPDGRKIAYIKQEGSHQALFVASSDGSGARNVTGSSGDFASPVFSPQYK